MIHLDVGDSTRARVDSMPLASEHVRLFYPNAIRSTLFLKTLIGFATSWLGKGEHQIAFLSSICSDDLNSVELPETRMIGPFTLGGLNGFPFVGKTGIGAFAHHVPEHGMALVFFGPHIGITNQGDVGRVRRPGQNVPSSCCGAAGKALAELEAGTLRRKHVHEYDLDDYQQESLRQIVLANAEEILNAGPAGDPRRILTMTEVLFRATREAMEKLLSTVVFEKPTFAFGGILINEDGGVQSNIDLRTVWLIEQGKVSNITNAFHEKTSASFAQLAATGDGSPQSP